MKSTTKTLTEQVLEQSGIILFFTFLASPFGYLIRIFLSRSLQPEDYGLFYAVMAAFTLFTNYLDLGFGTAALFYIPKFWLKKAFNQTWLTFVYTSAIELVTSLAVALGAMMASGWLSQYYFKHELAVALVPLFAMVLVLESITLCFKRLFVAVHKVHYYSSFEPIRFTVAFLVSGYLFLTHQTSVVFFAQAWLFSYIVTVGLCVVFFMSSFRHLLAWPSWSHSLFNQLKSYALPSLVNNFFTQLNSNTDAIFLTVIRGVGSVGVYNVTFPILVLPTMLFLPITKLFFPILSTLQEQKKGELKIVQFIESVLKIVPLVTLYFHVFIFLFAETTLATLFTYKWVEAAKTPLLWMAVMYLASILSTYLGLMLDGLGMVKQKMKMLTTISVLNALATLPAIYFFDVIGLIVVNGLVQFYLVGFYLKLLSQVYHFSIPWLLYGKYLAFFAAIGLLVMMFSIAPRSFSEFILFGMVYSCLVALFAYKQNLFAGYHKQSIAIIKRSLKLERD